MPGHIADRIQWSEDWPPSFATNKTNQFRRLLSKQLLASTPHSAMTKSEWYQSSAAGLLYSHKVCQ